MRTTLDLPDDLHRHARAIARDTGRSLSAVVADLLRRALRDEPAASLGRDPRTGLPTLDLGTPVTTEMVRDLEDDV
jgi:plasmid stability protein